MDLGRGILCLFVTVEGLKNNLYNSVVTGGEGGGVGGEEGINCSCSNPSLKELGKSEGNLTLYLKLK